MPFTYFPDEVGGTEIHVAALIGALRAHGIEGAVAAPGERDQAYAHAGVPVYRLAIDPRPDLAQAYGAPDRQVARSFGTLLARLRPRIVHLHARTAAVSEALVDVAQAAGAKIVFTYHTPTVSCIRGTMMRMGRSTCDGRLDRRRCSACALAAHGMPPLLRDVVACTPEAIGRHGRACPMGRARRRRAAPAGPDRGGASGLPRYDAQGRPGRRGLPLGAGRAAAERRAGRQTRALPSGVAAARRSAGDASPGRPRRQAPGVLRLGYFGRLDPAKGIDILIDALRRIPEAPVRLDIFAVRQAGSDPYASRLERRAAGDRRIVFRAALPPGGGARGDATVRHCRGAVALSRNRAACRARSLRCGDAGARGAAWRRGRTRLGRDRRGPRASRRARRPGPRAILDLANCPDEVARLRTGIRPPRTIDAVASEMAEVYRSLGSAMTAVETAPNRESPGTSCSCRRPTRHPTRRSSMRRA